MYNQSGIQNGIPWSVTQTSGNTFELKVGEKTETYTCTYPTVFGIDVWDNAMINTLLDKMEREIQIANLGLTATQIERRSRER